MLFARDVALATPKRQRGVHHRGHKQSLECTRSLSLSLSLGLEAGTQWPSSPPPTAAAVTLQQTKQVRLPLQKALRKFSSARANVLVDKWLVSNEACQCSGLIHVHELAGTLAILMCSLANHLSVFHHFCNRKRRDRICLDCSREVIAIM